MSDVNVLSVCDLSITFRTLSGPLPAVRNVSFEVKKGECYALIGESGSGKSTVAFAAMGYISSNGYVAGGDVRFMGESLTNYTHEQLRRFRGSRISMVFQNPHTAANPCYSIGDQLMETLAAHADVGKKEAWDKSVAMLEAVNIPSPERIMRQYPHQVSGGQKQRVTIAQALLCNPDLIIMDEPTTALDVTTEIQFLRLLQELREKFGISLLYITHDMGIVARVADRIGVIYAGGMVEEGTREDVFGAAMHPYTQGLMKSIPPLVEGGAQKTCSMPGMIPNLHSLPPGCVFAPRCPRPNEACDSIPELRPLGGVGRRVACRRPGPLTEAEIDMQSSQPASVRVKAEDRNDAAGARAPETPLLVVEDLRKQYETTSFLGSLLQSERKPVLAVNGVSFSLRAGETLGIVGESGCGKSTLANTITRLQPATSGKIIYKGKDIAGEPPRDKELSKSIQSIFQNPDSSLNPRHSVRTILARPLTLHQEAEGAGVEKRCLELLDMVRLPKNYLDRKPHQLSGGEKQRVGIARAFAAGPDFIICDEVTSALDVSVQASIISLLRDLQQELGVAYLYISHDLATVRQISHQIGVMYLGKIVEIGSAEQVFNPPYHPYTRALLSSISLPMLRQPHQSILLQGSIPSPESPPTGCAFSTRCYQNMVQNCSRINSALHFEGSHGIACHLSLDVLKQAPPLFPALI